MPVIEARRDMPAKTTAIGSSLEPRSDRANDLLELARSGTNFANPAPSGSELPQLQTGKPGDATALTLSPGAPIEGRRYGSDGPATRMRSDRACTKGAVRRRRRGPAARSRPTGCSLRDSGREARRGSRRIAQSHPARAPRF